MEEKTLEEQFRRIQAAGYDGVEAGLPDKKSAPLFRRLLAKHRLDFIPMIFTQGPDHKASFRALLGAAAKWKPRQVTAHSGKDHLPLQEQLDYFGEALRAEKEAGIPVAHETHRGRFLYNAQDTARLLKALPDLSINADFSHWCCVSESMLDDQEKSLRLACGHALHLHGRVGYEEGPQVPDPRAPEYVYALKKHETWWGWIIREHLKAKKKVMTFTPEFGPPPYMQTQPYSRRPSADLWEVCLWMARRFREKFNAQVEKGE